MATRQQIQDFLTACKQAIAKGDRSYRKPDVPDGLDELGIALSGLWERINALTPADYTRSPEDELNPRQPPGELYFFLQKHETNYVYIKLKLEVYDDGMKCARVVSFKKDSSNPKPRRPYAR